MLNANDIKFITEFVDKAMDAGLDLDLTLKTVEEFIDCLETNVTSTEEILKTMEKVENEGTRTGEGICGW